MKYFNHANYHHCWLSLSCLSSKCMKIRKYHTINHTFLTIRLQCFDNKNDINLLGRKKSWLSSFRKMKNPFKNKSTFKHILLQNIRWKCVPTPHVFSTQLFHLSSEIPDDNNAYLSYMNGQGSKYYSYPKTTYSFLSYSVVIAFFNVSTLRTSRDNVFSSPETKYISLFIV